jgi:hypothetical protein
MEEKLDYYSRNKEARREYQRLYYQKNKGRIKNKRKRDAVENPESYKERQKYNRDYYLRNKKSILLRRQKRYAASKQKAVGNPF